MKIVSIMIEPPTANGKMFAKTVIIGSSEFLKACFITTFPSPKPLARAVRM